MSLTSYSFAGNKNYSGRQASNHFPLPYLDYTSTAVPQNLTELWDWSEFIYMTSEVREINRRLFNYFITDVRIRPIDAKAKPLADTEENNWRRLLSKKLKWKLHAEEMLTNFGVYGNDFVSLVTPIQRYLFCRRCSSLSHLETFAKDPQSDFKYKDGKFHGRCQSIFCKRSSANGVEELIPRDIRLKDAASFRIKHWPVREMVLYHYAITDETKYYWRPPLKAKKAVQQGDLHTLATTDLGILKAIERDQLFKFKENRLFHAKESTISGIEARGWGLPRSLYMVRQQWTLQMVRKQIQALGIDFITPMRLLSPSSTSMGSLNGISMSPNTMIAGNDFNRIMQKIRSAHRRDPTNVHSVSVPVEYQVIGGEANQLFPQPLFEQAKKDLVEAGGYPMEIYDGSLTVQAAPVGLRLFESTNQSIVQVLNDALDFIAERVSEFGGKDPVEAEHERVTIVDNVETWMAQLQLATAGQLSMQEPLRRLGINVRDDMLQREREALMLQESQEEQQARMEGQQAAMGELQQAAQGPAPASGQGEQPVDPNAGMMLSNGLIPSNDPAEMQAQAASLAQILAGADNVTRQRELQIAREQFKAFHALLTSALEDVRQQAANQGQQMVLQGQAPAVPAPAPA